MGDVIHGDCLAVMKDQMLSESVDAVVTDPPYGLGFMGKAWDHGAPGVPFWAEMLRVAKPSSYLLAFGGTRTVHRIATAIEDAGWIIRDMLVWAYASGFPKGKANLKPAWEPIVMARKPGPLRDLNIDACRIGFETVEGAGLDVNTHLRPSVRKSGTFGTDGNSEREDYVPPAGRWPANVILTDPIFDGGIEGVVGGGETGQMPGNYERTPVNRGSVRTYGNGKGIPDLRSVTGFGDSGTYSRFFLIPKAGRAEREPVSGLLPDDAAPFLSGRLSDPRMDRPQLRRARANVHPTVKPVDLMRHLVRLVTPPGGTVLDPFLGSGTTGIACEMEGFPWIGIEKEAEYVAIAEARLVGVQRGFGLSA